MVGGGGGHALLGQRFQLRLDGGAGSCVIVHGCFAALEALGEGGAGVSEAPEGVVWAWGLGREGFAGAG